MNIGDENDLTPADDDLKSVSNASQDAAERPKEFLLKQASEVGLEFEPTASTETYGLSDGSKPLSDESAAVQNASPNDAPKIESSVSADDVYGLATPEPEPIKHAAPKPRPDGVQSDASDQSNEKQRGVLRESFNRTKAAAKAKSQEEEVSVETLRRRRERELAKEEERAKQPTERRPLPARPFRDGILKPFASPGCLARLSMVAGAAFIPLFLATLFISGGVSVGIARETARVDIGTIQAFFRVIFQHRIIFLLFCFLWGDLSVPLSFQIFSDTASGSDKISEWPEFSFFGGMTDFLWVVVLVILAGAPGAIVFQLLGVDYTIGMTISSTLIAPAFFLSCMQSDSRFALLTKEVCASFKHKPLSWIVFSGISFIFLFGTLALALAALSFAVEVNDNPEPMYGRVAIISAVLSLCFTFIPALYLRFLGRLAWIIEDDGRKRAKEAEEKEKKESQK